MASNGSLFSSEVYKVEEKTFSLVINGDFPFTDGTNTIIVVTPSGFKGFSVQIKSHIKDDSFEFIHTNKIVPVIWSNPGNLKMADEIIMTNLSSRNILTDIRVRKIQEDLVLVENISGNLKKGQDVRIYFTHPGKGIPWVNGEVTREYSDKKNYIVKLNHVRKNIIK
ncbi:MAG: hypothetical protein JEY99_16290 [Spirochaetales bacterium]|nr:hypothetical protein [Spirochaetales bacterium]